MCDKINVNYIFIRISTVGILTCRGFDLSGFWSVGILIVGILIDEISNAPRQDVVMSKYIIINQIVGVWAAIIKALLLRSVMHKKHLVKY